MPRRQDQLTFLSTSAEATYGTATAAANMNRRYNFGSNFPEDAPNIDVLNVCGGRHPTGGQVLTIDRRFNFEGRCYPDLMHWQSGYNIGTYSVSGASDPYLGKAVPLAAGDYTLDSFTAYKSYQAAGVYFQYKGCQSNTWSVQGSDDGANAALTFNMSGLTDGTRTEVTSYTEAVCNENDVCYRFSDVTPSFGIYTSSTSGVPNGTPLTGITNVFQGFQIGGNNNIQTDPRRVGTAVAIARENGDEEFTGTLTFQGSPSDQIDDIWQSTLGGSPVYVFLVLTCANPTANRAMIFTGLKGLITQLSPVFIRSNQTHGHQLNLRFVYDNSDAGSRVASPLQMTVQGSTATMRV